MAWDGPILTDSGGFQVFSLRHTILRQDDDGLTFRSVYDGDEARFTPELAARIQAQLGSDIAMCLDVVPPPDAPRSELEQAVRRTTLWAKRQQQAERAPGQLLFGIAQGGSDPELRRRSVEEIAELGFDGHALGGLAIGEPKEQMLETTAWAAELLPAERPRYFMGIGDPVGILEVIERGIDMFDCVLPTRNARTGSALTWEGQLNLKGARFARDPRPLDEGCACPACTRFSRAYVRHLLNQQEILGLRLLSLHNLRFVLDLVAGARDAIERGRLAVVQGGGAGAAAAARRRQPRGLPDHHRRAVRGPVAVPDPPAEAPAGRAGAACRTRSRAGDEILTAGGIHGTVRGIEDEVVQVEIAPGTIVRLDRRAVAAVVQEPEPEPENRGGSGRPGFARRKLICCGSNEQSALPPDPGRPDPRGSGRRRAARDPELAGAQEGRRSASTCRAVSRSC